ncbi:MAG: UvrD-helicase domain-containing protein [Spirochaetales bacterium]|nr:UvrD-helicase domain-containing protein [Spirochaetales bacterium]
MKTPDADQIKAIHSLTNTVVTAGAGSGKTTVLAERFLHLLRTQGVSIDQVLALTFTNKAAAEMYERIYRSLLDSPEAELRAPLLDFHKAQISTIDSFSAQVARAAASRFGLPPDFTIDEEAVGKLAEDTALEFYLAHSFRLGVERLVGKFGLNGFCAGVLGRIALEYLSLAEEADFPGLLARQYAFLEEALPTHLEAYEAACASLLDEDFQTYKTIIENRGALGRAGELPGLAAAGRWEEAVALVGTVKLVKPGGRASETAVRLKEAIDAAKREAAVLGELFLAFAERGVRADIHDLLAAFQKAFHDKKRAAGLVSFTDVARMAVAALRDNRPLREHYKARFRFIMIDEFQDNNHLQKELLFLLAEKRSLSLDRVPSPAELEPDKLFFVGDEKQSIYGFRGAEVDVFKALKREIAAQGGAVVTLSRNYRSRPGLIDFFNRLFTRVMEDPADDFEAEFEALTPALPPGRNPPEITLFYRRSDESGDEDDEGSEFDDAESEAFAVAAYIRDTVESGSLPLETAEGGRPAGYADFALLLRSTGNQIVFERMFRHVGVPYVTQNVRSLFMEPPVNDIYALLQCALHSGDRAAYAALLRSPFVGLSDAGLLAALYAGTGPFDPVPGLSPEDEAAFSRGGEGWERIRGLIDRKPVSRLVFFAWYELGYRYFILRNPSAAMYLEYYDYLYALALRADQAGQTLEEFLAWIRANLGQYEKLEEIELTQAGRAGVKIMTIHKAKGLQFPIVVAANLGNRGRNRERRAAVLFSRRFGPVVNLGQASYLAEQSEDEEKRRELAELKRLLYVGLTRAEQHLVLSGVHTRNNLTAERAHLTMIFNALGLTPDELAPFAGPGYGARVLPIPDLDRSAFAKRGLRGAARDLCALEKSYRAAVRPAPRVRRSEYTVTELNDLYRRTFPEGEYEERALALPDLEADKRLKTDEARARWGTLAHRVMHDKLLGRYSEALLPISLRSGFEEGAFAALCAEAERLADGFLASPWGKRWAGAAERETEFPFLFRYPHPKGDYFIRGAVDLFFTEGNRAYLLDFKTDRSLNPLEYEVQLGIYRAALTALLRRPVSAALYSLRNGSTVDLPDGFDLHNVFDRIENSNSPI